MTGAGRAHQGRSWEKVRAIARRDLVIQLSYKVEFALWLEGMAVAVASFAFLARLVPAGQLGPYRGGYFEFAVVGMVITRLVTASLSAVTDAVSREQQQGTFEMLLVGPAPFPIVLAGGAVVALGTAVIGIMMILLAALLVFGPGLSLGGAALAVPVIAASLASFTSIGILSTAVVLLFKRGDPITAVFASTAGLLGGALFPVKVMPGWLQAIAHVLPTYYAIDGLRGSLLGGVTADRVFRDVAVLLAFTAVVLPVALWSATRALAAARRAGTLGTY